MSALPCRGTGVRVAIKSSMLPYLPPEGEEIVREGVLQVIDQPLTHDPEHLSPNLIHNGHALVTTT